MSVCRVCGGYTNTSRYNKASKSYEPICDDCVGVMVQNYEPVTFEEVLANYETHRKMTMGVQSEWTSDKEKANECSSS